MFGDLAILKKKLKRLPCSRSCTLRRLIARQYVKVCFRFSRTLRGSEPCLGLFGYRCRVVFGTRTARVVKEKAKAARSVARTSVKGGTSVREPRGNTIKILEMAARKQGVSRAELIKLTGWQGAPWKWNFSNWQKTGGSRMHFFDIASDCFNSSYKRIKIRLYKEYRLQFPPDHCVWSGLHRIASPNIILAEPRDAEIVSRGPILGVYYCHSFARVWIAHLCDKNLSCKVLSEL